MTSTPVANAFNRAPVEIWRRIFELYLGPSLLEPEEPTLRGYQAFLDNEQTLLQRYVSIERERGDLRLVCSSWRELADTMGDRIMISHLDEHDWPPYRRRQDAKYICYRQWTECSEYNPVSVYRRRIHRENVEVFPRPIKLDSSQLPLAPFTSLVTLNLDFSSIGPEVDPAHVHYLRISPFASLHSMAHPIFHNVRILDLSGIYPFENFAGTVRDRVLPNLICLIIHVRDLSHPNSRAPTNILSSWHFPKLVMFSFSLWFSPQGPSEDLLNFIYAHAATLEELDVTYKQPRDWARQIDWLRFVRLRSIKELDLPAFANAIPTLARRWRSICEPAVDLPPTRLLQLHITVYRSLPTPEPLLAAGVLTELRLYPSVFRHLTLHLSEEWTNILRKIDAAYNYVGGHDELRRRLRHHLQTLIELFALIDELKVPFFDSDGGPADSDEANALRARLYSSQ